MNKPTMIWAGFKIFADETLPPDHVKFKGKTRARHYNPAGWLREPRMIGRTYHRRYGYPWRYAIPAEIAWRIEHLPGRSEWQPFSPPISPIALWGYRKRHEYERKGYVASQASRE